MIIPKQIVEIWQDWQQDWCLAAKELLGANLDPEQQEILRSVQHNKMTSVASGTARGKDYVAAVAAILFLYLTPEFDTDGNLVANTKVALTAPTGRQVDNIMYPEIKRLFNYAKKVFPILAGRTVASDIRTEFEEWFLTGFKADEYNHEAWSGFHAVNTMFVVTEASGISDNTFAAIEGNLQGNSRILLVFNPNVTTGYAAKTQKSQRWQRFRLNSLTAPNVTKRKIIIPGQVDYDWVADKLDNWCTKITRDEIKEEFDDFQFEGQWYRPEDMFRIKVLGKFPKIDEDVLIPQFWIEQAQERWRDNYDLTGRPLRIGADVAGMGRDNTVRCYRYDNYVKRFKKHNSGGTADHMKVAGMLKHDLDSYTDSVAMIDTIGEGAGVYSRLIELGMAGRAISCKYSEAAKHNGKDLTDMTGERKFVNMRAWLFWCVRDWLDPKHNTGAMLPPGDSFVEEATEIKFLFRSDGKIIIEPKDDIKKRLGRSTDEFDALANTFYPEQKIIEIDISKLEEMLY
ncbi:MAG: hypothetical protein AAGU19_07990 [Prolixibacteraceae bacterium]